MYLRRWLVQLELKVLEDVRNSEHVSGSAELELFHADASNVPIDILGLIFPLILDIEARE
jgi:hypothetical protein